MARCWQAEAHAVLPTGGTSDWKIPPPPESWHLTATASSSTTWLPLLLRIPAPGARSTTEHCRKYRFW